MRRWITLALVVIALLAAGAGYYCWSVMPSPGVSRSLADKIRASDGQVIDFTEAVSFDWDRVFIFGPYTSPDRIDECLGFKWHAKKYSGIDSSRATNLVVFVRNDQVVCWFDHPRSQDFRDLPNPPAFDRANAKFRVVRHAGDRFELSHVR